MKPSTSKHHLFTSPRSSSASYSLKKALTSLPYNRDTGLASIEALITKRGGFNYILLETSGLADPGNLAPLFWTDDGLGSNIYLDGIVTVVDAKNIITSLSEEPTVVEGERHAGEHLTTAHLQISHADVLVVNKADAVTPGELQAVVQRVKGINGLAKVHVTEHSKVPQLEGFLLDLHAYDGVKSLEGFEGGHSHVDPVHLFFTVSVSDELTTLLVNLHHRPASPYPLQFPALRTRKLASPSAVGKYAPPTVTFSPCFSTANFPRIPSRDSARNPSN